MTYQRPRTIFWPLTLEEIAKTVNTPAHAIASLLILADPRRPQVGLPLAIGALLPDAPIVAFYA